MRSVAPNGGSCCGRWEFVGHKAHIDAGAGDCYLRLWPQSVRLELTENPQCVELENHSSPRDSPELAAAGLDRLEAVGKITWCPSGCRRPDLRACPSQLIVKPDKVLAARDWSNPARGLSGMIVKPPAAYGGTDGFPSLLLPGPLWRGWIFRIVSCIGWCRPRADASGA